MTSYPTLDASAWPSLPAAQYCHPLSSWQTQSGALRTRIPLGAWAEAGIDLANCEPRVAVIAGKVLLVAQGPLWDAMGPDARIARDGIRRVVSSHRVPGVDLSNGRAVIGDGYILLLSAADHAEFAALPTLERLGPILTEASIAKVDAPLPRQKALGFKRYGVTKLVHKTSRFVDLGGRIWEAAGMNRGDLILVTRYRDGVRITKATGYANDGALVTKRGDEGRVYASKRFGEAVLYSIKQNTVRVAFTSDAILLLGDSIKLAEFGLSNRLEIEGGMQLEDGEFQPKAKIHTTNYAVYPVRREEPRIQVQGDWLERFGFVPGVRFALEEHPLFRGRVLVRIDPEGAHTVTQHRPGQPGGKLYIPTKLLQHFNSPDVKVWGNVEGLHVQQHFASSWRAS